MHTLRIARHRAGKSVKEIFDLVTDIHRQMPAVLSAGSGRCTATWDGDRCGLPQGHVGDHRANGLNSAFEKVWRPRCGGDQLGVLTPKRGTLDLKAVDRARADAYMGNYTCTCMGGQRSPSCAVHGKGGLEEKGATAVPIGCYGATPIPVTEAADHLPGLYRDVCAQRDKAQAQLAKAVAPQALKEELVAYANRWESLLIDVKQVVCEVCCTSYVTGDGEHGLCPKCYPGTKTYNSRLTDPKFWPGHRFVWSDSRGPKGRWVLLENNITVKLADIRRLGELLPPTADRAVDVFTLFEAEMKRLQAIAREVAAPIVERAEASAKSAMKLADKCGDLEAKLDQKRIECDVLGDEVTRLRRKP
ncbi:MAG: hypothetical protein V3W41_21930 [Planctomycetota bacterium]